MLEWLVTLKAEPKNGGNRIVEYKIQIIAHKDSAFDTYVVLNNLTNWYRKLNIVKNGKGINSLKISIELLINLKKSMFLKILPLDVEWHILKAV